MSVSAHPNLQLWSSVPKYFCHQLHPQELAAKGVDLGCRAAFLPYLPHLVIPPPPPPPQLPLTYLSRPGLDLLPLLPLGFALGRAFSFAVQALDQLLDNGVGRRGADFLVLLGGEPVSMGRGVCCGIRGSSTRGGRAQTTVEYLHNSTQHASRFGALDAVGLHPLDGDGLLAGLQAAV